jgi:hypothetical protein
MTQIEAERRKGRPAETLAGERFTMETAAGDTLSLTPAGK